MTNDVAEAIMEQKAGAVPSWDLLSLSNHIALANQAGVLGNECGFIVLEVTSQIMLY